MADLTLATIPIAAAVLVGCLDLYRLYTETKQLGNASQTLLWKFRIQHTRLQIFGEEWGLLASSHHASSNRDGEDDHLVLETLLRISDILKDYEKLKKRYGLSLVSDESSGRSPALIARHNTLEDLIASEFEQFKSQDTDLQKSRTKATKFLTKFRWAVADKSKLELIINDLKDCNDGLYHLLSATERRRLRRGLGPELVSTNQPGELEDLQEASQGDDLLPNVCGLRKLHGQLSAPSWKSQTAVGSNVSNDVGKLKIQLKDLSWDGLAQKADTSRHTATLWSPSRPSPPLNVLIEWRTYNPETDERVQDDLVERLACLLHVSASARGLCVPACIGFVTDHLNFRTGIVYRNKFHDQMHSADPTLSLSSLLSMKGVPPLEDRFKLALELVSSLSILHTSDWLHKNIKSDNIIFFGPIPSKGVVARIHQPSIVGFEFSRPNEAEAISELVAGSGVDYYRHPDAQGATRKRYCPAFDIYSLGVMLLEIGYWRRIAEFWKPDYSPQAFRHDLWKFHAPRLAPKTGSIYASVVANCLGGELSNGTLDDAESQRQFYWSVVNELSRILV